MAYNISIVLNPSDGTFAAKLTKSDGETLQRIVRGFGNGDYVTTAFISYLHEQDLVSEMILPLEKLEVYCKRVQTTITVIKG